jgi:iron(III) transport system substrate-binding protein
MRARRPAVLAAAVALALSLAACGGSPTASDSGTTKKAAGSAAGQRAQAAQKVYDQLNGLTGEERTKKLVEMAEAEGKLSIYTSNTDMEDLISDFEDQYDIDVSVYRGNSESVLQRVLQEQKANFFGNDILETNALELNVANKEGYLAEYKSELRDKVRKEGQASNWTASRFNVFVIGWNTKLVKKGEEPKTFEELADPKWKGKVAMEVGDVDWFTALYDWYLAQGKSEQEVKDLFAKVAANSKIVKGHTVQGELLSAGQFAVAVSVYSHTVDKAADKGAPVAWRPASGEPAQPIVIRPNGVGMMKTAANPAAAMLFVDYELTGGQKVFEKKFRIGSIPTGKDDPLAGLETVAVPEKKLLDDPKTWDSLYESITQGGQKVEG